MQNQSQVMYPVLDDAEIEELLDQNNPKCPFNTYVGNTAAVDEIMDLAYAAFNEFATDLESGEEFCTRKCAKRIALLGRPSVGKTSFARIFLKELLDLPFCELVPEMVTNTEALFELLESAYKQEEIEIVVEETRGDVDYIQLPPGGLFIDEVHLLPKAVQDSLLKVTESADGLLLLKDKVVDCRQLCIIIATTDTGKLREAFKTRFRQIKLKPHTVAEVAKIIKINYPSWTDKQCMMVARLKPVPREAKDFADSVIRNMRGKKRKIEESIQIVADREGVKDGGVNATAVETLKLLSASDGLSKATLCTALHIQVEEFENDVLPCLVSNELHPALIEISNRHYITKEGKEYLESVEK
jgi:Holliday junction resolvasome RuvABC ATP-dependent DNA helicase subunit